MKNDVTAFHGIGQRTTISYIEFLKFHARGKRPGEASVEIINNEDWTVIQPRELRD